MPPPPKRTERISSFLRFEVLLPSPPTREVLFLFNQDKVNNTMKYRIGRVSQLYWTKTKIKTKIFISTTSPFRLAIQNHVCYTTRRDSQRVLVHGCISFLACCWLTWNTSSHTSSSVFQTAPSVGWPRRCPSHPSSRRNADNYIFMDL